MILALRDAAPAPLDVDLTLPRLVRHNRQRALLVSVLTHDISLRRYYPDQVQGVARSESPPRLSARGLPRSLFSCITHTVWGRKCKAFDDYVLLAPLGAGQMGKVYLAEDTMLARNVARQNARRAAAALRVAPRARHRHRPRARDWLKFPVIGVSAVDAEAYAAWLRSTGTLPG